MTLFLYGTSSCHLCEEAATLLLALSKELQFHWSEVDIVENENLMQHYGLKIPVLYRLDNKTELFWPFSASDIQIFLTR